MPLRRLLECLPLLLLLVRSLLLGLTCQEWKMLLRQRQRLHSGLEGLQLLLVCSLWLLPGRLLVRREVQWQLSGIALGGQRLLRLLLRQRLLGVGVRAAWAGCAVHCARA